jgi:predicted small integral membrane protein
MQHRSMTYIIKDVERNPSEWKTARCTHLNSTKGYIRIETTRSDILYMGILT